MSKRVTKDNGKYHVHVLPSEFKTLENDKKLAEDFLIYCYALRDNDKEVYLYYEHSYHGTKYQSLFSRNVGDN